MNTTSYQTLVETLKATLEEALAKLKKEWYAANKLGELIKEYDPSFVSPFSKLTPAPEPERPTIPAPEPITMAGDQRCVNKADGKIKVYQVNNVRDAVLKVLPYQKSKAIPTRIIIRRIKELGLNYEKGTIECAISNMHTPTHRFHGYKGPDGSSMEHAWVQPKYRRKGLHPIGYFKQWV
jgi:hypothetical protein